MAHKKDQGERVTLSTIRETYLDGDFELCLMMCERFKSRDAKDRAEIVLFRARCLIQLERGDEALEGLRGLRLGDDQHDEYITGRMLISAAYVNLGQYDEAMRIAQKAFAEIGKAHPTVRSEMTLTLAIVHHRKGEYARAERLLTTIPETEDIVYVRALQFRGNIARACGKFPEALDKYHEAFARLDRCRHHDRFTEAILLFSLASLCAELPRLDLWPEVSKRIEEFDWSVSGVTTWRYYIALASSIITELLGKLEESTEWASLAEEIASDPASLIGAWCRLAASLGRYGEKRAHAFLTKKAMRQYDAMPRDSRLREHVTLSLEIAEEILYSDSFLRATRLVSYYAEVVAPGRGVGIQGRKMDCHYGIVLGLLEERRGNKGRAREAYARAFEISSASGLMRVASVVAYRLFTLTGDQQYTAFIEHALPGVSDTYWVKAGLLKKHTEARLTPRQLQVIRLVARGLSNKEVGTALGVTEGRVRNILATLFPILGVRSRAELATVASARGLLRPE